MTAMPTVLDRIHDALDGLTRAERQLAQSLLDGYPAAGLGPLATLASEAGVSVPTVARTIQKLGFDGYGTFQAALRDEVRTMTSAPSARRTEAPEAAEGLGGFAAAVARNIDQSLAQIDPEEFERACGLIADPARHVSVVGGRVTHIVAEYLFQHLQIIRPGVTHIRSTSNTWPQYLLDVAEGDVFVLFDTRRYETNTQRLAEMARECGARLILVTDQWRSPVHALAEICLAVRTGVPSPWDSAAVPIVLVEAMIAAVHDASPGGDDRMARLEAMFDRTRLFRKFT